MRYHTPQPSPVADRERRRRALAHARSCRPFYRVLRVVRPGRAAATSTRGRSAAFGRTVERLSAPRSSARSDEFQVTAPDRRAGGGGRVVARRRRGGCCCSAAKAGALLLAFTILAAAALRRDVTDARRRLLWVGARRWQVELHTLAEIGRARARSGRSSAGVARRRDRRGGRGAGGLARLAGDRARACSRAAGSLAALVRRRRRGAAALR